MNPFIQLKKATPLFLAAIMLACFGLSGTVQAVSPAPEKLDQINLTEVVPGSATAPLIDLLQKASRPTPQNIAHPGSPEPTLPEEFRNFTPTTNQDPSESFVGTLVTKNSDGKFTSTSNPIFLIDKVCKPSITSDTKENTVFAWAQKMHEGAELDLVFVKLHFGKDEAVQLTLSRIGSIKPTSGIDDKIVDYYKKILDVEHNKQKYWICTGQELFLTTYQKFHKDTAGGSGSYSVVKINGTYFSQIDELRKLYNFRLGLVLLEDWH
jgi:hypothetical protein